MKFPHVLEELILEFWLLSYRGRAGREVVTVTANVTRMSALDASDENVNFGLAGLEEFELYIYLRQLRQTTTNDDNHCALCIHHIQLTQVKEDRLLLLASCKSKRIRETVNGRRRVEGNSLDWPCLFASLLQHGYPR